MATLAQENTVMAEFGAVVSLSPHSLGQRDTSSAPGFELEPASTAATSAVMFLNGQWWNSAKFRVTGSASAKEKYQHVRASLTEARLKRIIWRSSSK